MDFKTLISVFTGIVGVLVGVIVSEELTKKEMELEKAKLIMDETTVYVSQLRYLSWLLNENNEITEESEEKKSEFRNKVNNILYELQPHAYRIEVLLLNDEESDLYKYYFDIKKLLEEKQTEIKNLLSESTDSNYKKVPKTTDELDDLIKKMLTEISRFLQVELI